MLSAISESMEAELRRTFEQIIPFNRVLGLRIGSLDLKAPRLRFDMRPSWLEIRSAKFCTPV